MTYRIFAVWVFACGLAAGARDAHATLGERAASVESDTAKLHATLKVTPHGGYAVHEMTLDSGTLVREFIGDDGVVFGVAWRGPAIPDLRQTLGKYFADYSAEASTKHGGHNRLHLARSDLVIEAGGHMRAFSGRAYLPATLPAGVTADDIR
jgi:Protein of unknown function (DUF2844)